MKRKDRIMEIKFPPSDKAIKVKPRRSENYRNLRDGWFRFKKLKNKVLLTNDLGDYSIVDEKYFYSFIRGEIDYNHPVVKKLIENNLLLPYLDVEKLIERYREKNSFVGTPPFLHIIIPTLRCNTNCIYCHAGKAPMNAKNFDMDLKTAKAVVDFIFKTPSHQLSIEFQGGEPLANFDAIKFIIEYAEELNKKEKRQLQFLLVTNLSLMDEEKLEFLIKHDVLMCTSIDGPPFVHNFNRRFKPHGSYETAIYWMNQIHSKYKQLGRDLDIWHVDALVTTSRYSLKHPKEIVDEYVKLGIKTTHIRPLNPMGFASRLWEKFGYTAEEFIEFYLKALDYIIELNLKGVELIERGAALFLARILSDTDPQYVDLRSPCGAGVGQVAYNYDGGVYTCDEGRMVARMGDNMFKIGDVMSSLTYQELINHETVKSICIASCLQGLPGCKDCVYLPYCGICPVYNYITQGSIFGQMATNDRCKINRAILDHLFEILSTEDKKIIDTFNRWIINKPRIKNIAGGA